MAGIKMVRVSLQGEVRDVAVERGRALGALGVRVVCDLERMGDRWGGDDLRAQIVGELLCVDGSGHRAEVELPGGVAFAQQGDFLAHGEHEVRIQLTLVDFVDEYRAHAFEGGVGEEAVEEDSWGDEFHEAAGVVFAADAVADTVAYAGAVKVGEAPGGGADGHTARRGDKNLRWIGRVRCVLQHIGQRGRDEGCLACSRGCFHYQWAALWHVWKKLGGGEARADGYKVKLEGRHRDDCKHGTSQGGTEDAVQPGIW